jgi:hypothetical protein
LETIYPGDTVVSEIYGEDDPAGSPVIGQEIADAIPWTRLEVIPGAPAR